MSNKNPEKKYNNMTDMLSFVFEQMTKNLYITIPGIVDSYDSATKRAIVHPAINIEKTDGETVLYESIVNVPVVWPSGGGFTVLSPLPSGEPVLICFSQRGITKFKETFAESDPGIGLFDKEDAYIIAGFGGLSVTPATENGISIQSEAGTDYIFVENNKIEIKSAALVNVECVNLIASVTNITTLICPTVNITGDVVITGGISWSGTAQGVSGPAAFSGGLVNAGGDIVSDGISLETHTHPINSGSSAPGPTGTPT